MSEATPEIVLDSLVAAAKVRALCWPISQYADQAEELMADHPFLIPEIEAANMHVAEAGEALRRAITALTARYEAGRS